MRRLVAIDPVPFLPGYRWHPLARAWRIPLLGEVAMGMAIGPWCAACSPPGGPSRCSPRSIRAPSGPSCGSTARARRRCSRRPGRGLGTIAAPALVLQGERDRYIPSRFADGLAAALGDGRVEHVPGAGHWPWLDRPELIGRVADFLDF